MLLTRRVLIDLAARAALVPGASEFFAAWLRGAPAHQHGPDSGAPPDPLLLRNYKPLFFDPADFDALRSFTEILIPTDDSPGAREAYCAHYIDFVLQASLDHMPAMQKPWREAMAALKQAGFHAADAHQRTSLIEEMSKPERDPQATHPAFSAYRLIKQQNAFAFYTSRAGMIETLDYKGNSYNLSFPGCNHPEHQVI